MELMSCNESDFRAIFLRLHWNISRWSALKSTRGEGGGWEENMGKYHLFTDQHIVFNWNYNFNEFSCDVRIRHNVFFSFFMPWNESNIKPFTRISDTNWNVDWFIFIFATNASDEAQLEKNFLWNCGRGRKECPHVWVDNLNFQ